VCWYPIFCVSLSSIIEYRYQPLGLARVTFATIATV